jgi:uncharacterized linocin/CFP29 family protein
MTAFVEGLWRPSVEFIIRSTLPLTTSSTDDKPITTNRVFRRTGTVDKISVAVATFSIIDAVQKTSNTLTVTVPTLDIVPHRMSMPWLRRITEMT